MNSTGHCHACRCEQPVSTTHTGKMAGAAIGAGIAKLVDKSPWAPVIGGILGIVAGEVADRTILPRCPTCGAVLTLIGTALS